MVAGIIKKTSADKASANMPDYNKLIESFSWKEARRRLNGLPGGGLNIAHEAVDRHLDEGNGGRVAIRWISKSDSRTDITYRELSGLTNRFANLMRNQGFKKGDRVYSLLGRRPELFIAALGALKAGCVFCPLFSAFGPEPIRDRLKIGEGNLLITTGRLFERKVEQIREALPDLRAILIIDDPLDGTLSYSELMSLSDDEFQVEPMKDEDMALLHFTSGTTGKPKGVVHVHAAVTAHRETGRIALDLHPGDIYWCTADPGWVTGTSYGIIAPLANGVTMIVDEAEFDAERWYGILQDEKVSVWYTAPTAIRMLMKAGSRLFGEHGLLGLRFMASVGEPLNPEAVVWGHEVLGKPFHDNWWQTETGGIMIANYASMDVKPGSMGKPLPGIEASIIEMTADGASEISEPDATGELALRLGWPSMMRAYLHRQERYDRCFSNGWYLSGDIATRDADGYYWFVGRSDDLIKSAGHLIGPFEVESALMEHPAISEAGVIGIPDETAGEIVKAYVALKEGHQPDEELRLELIGHARKRLGPAVAPKEIIFRKNLPKTRSGKIMRRLLKARELGLPEGDISTLESDEQ
ncbi:MAG: acetate--CoA ligase [Rhizobiaceae bacterium]